ncbi:hypothetical protein [Aeromonas jandaei]|uniref:hypothetical protein n=1 Tax=Aeromonas jandaei TaxID=650 RepID=UPI003D240360
MNKIIAIIFLSVCSFSVFAGPQCFDNVKLAYVNSGFVDGSIADANGGNGIYFGYYDAYGNLLESKVNLFMNLDDGNKGVAIYHSLTTALTMGLKVSGWDHNVTSGSIGSCDDIDEIRLSY